MPDLTITAEDVINSDAATIIKGDSASAISAGQVVYKLANGKFGLADADGISPLFKVAGIAINSTAGADQPLSVCTNDPVFGTGATGLVSGDIYVLSATAGGIAPASDLAEDMNVQILGVAISDTEIYLKIVNSNAVVPP